ncbi:MAG: site-specific DNA-methyltransferase [Oscillospiraceae bacterium]|nr:site-specific DNA-methyltransferase [Oscillospiraceae bacterium]
MTKLDGRTPDLAEEHIEQLKQIFPDVFEEGKIDFDKLKQDLGEYVDDGSERYNFTWNGKGRALKLSQTPSMGTLRPCEAESKNWGDTRNLYIEGDNLEVLKLLQKSYHGKIKMIYIDPPYNTGSDFVYPDDFSDSIENYRKLTGQVDDEGRKISTNSEASGRYHTDWLNMMYPRLRLARNLLTDDGVIFISIDDNEVDNLMKMCSEIFGEQNYIANLVRKTKTTSNNGNQFAPSHEYIIVCAKSADTLNVFNDPEAQETEDYIKLFKYEDNYSKYNIIGLFQPALKHGGSTYPIECPDGSFVITPDNKPWRWNEQTFLKGKSENRVVFKRTDTSPLIDLSGNQAKWNIYTKLYLKERLEAGMRPITFIEKYTNSEASKELIKMEIPFDFSKPYRLIQYLIKICVADQNSYILDFFSGSATTAHAVIQLNADDGGNRKFIMVQLPEPCAEDTEAAKAGYKNISEIGKERIRRAGEKIKAEVEEQNAQLKIDEEPKKVPDIGFKVFKLDSSNLKKWQPDYDHFEQTLWDSVGNYMEGRSELDVVYEIMLKMGLDLTWPLDKHTIGGKNVYAIGMGALMICLDDNITTDVADGMAALHKELAPETWKVVFKDNGFTTDSAKVNVKEILKCAGLDEDAFTTV